VNVPANIRTRSLQERIERFVGDCQRILIAKRHEDDLERREVALRIILASNQPITMEETTHLTDADFAAVSEEDDAYANYGEVLPHPQF